MKNPPILYMLVGPPASGKSTWTDAMLDKNPNMVVLSSDNIVEELASENDLTYNEAYPLFAKQALTAMNENKIKFIKERKSIIHDQTNLSTGARRKKMASYPKMYRKVAVVFNVSPSELSRRMEQRRLETGKFIPQESVDKMMEYWQYPSLEEGFDEIIEVNDV